MKEDVVFAAAHLKALPSPTRAVETLFQEHHALVYRAALRVTGNAADAEDVLQTVFVRLLNRNESPNISEGAATYFRRAAINASIDSIRKKQRRPVEVGDDALSGVARDDPDIEHREHIAKMSLVLRKTMADLPPRTAEMFALKYLEGMSNREIASLLGTSPAVVGVTLFRTRRQLRKALFLTEGGVS